MHNLTQYDIIFVFKRLVMRLQTNNSKSSQSLYVVKTVYFNKKKTNKVVEKLGTYDELKKN